MSEIEQNTFNEIFFSKALIDRKKHTENNGRFAYYTTAATAHLILKNEELWMRNTAVMNDSSEIAHGLECLIHAYKSAQGEELRSALDLSFPNLSSELSELFDSWTPTIRRHTYILSVSEHSETDDQYGRLSMWRAYGGNAGVAFIFNSGPMHRPTDALKAYSSPVAYLSPEGVAEEMSRIAKGLIKYSDLIKQKNRDWLKAAMFETFRFAVICTKHPAFLEEREWRVLSTQILHDSERLKPVPEIIGGITQLVLKLKLKNIPEEGLTGLAIPEFLERILIGPCDHPEVIASSLVSLLNDHGVADAAKKVHITGVPLRLNQK